MMLEVTLAAAALVAAILALVGPKLMKTKRETVDDLILAISEEYSRRLSKLEGRIVDLQVRLDILEGLIEKEQKRVPQVSSTKSAFEFVMSQGSKSDITKPSEMLGDFELAILKCIEEGAKSPAEVRSVVGRSREHVARALKELFEKGYLDRRGGRPFIYSLSDKGRAVLKGVDLSV